jgi:D-arabinose 1-dehydrogenase-like Zn-dependent alcohol dehydrogenase
MKAMILERLAPMDMHLLRLVDGADVAKERHVYPIPDSIPDAEVATHFCPGITAFGAVVESFPLERAEEALRRLPRGHLEARAVVVP